VLNREAAGDFLPIGRRGSSPLSTRNHTNERVERTLVSSNHAGTKRATILLVAVVGLTVVAVLAVMLAGLLAARRR